MTQQQLQLEDPRQAGRPPVPTLGRQCGCGAKVAAACTFDRILEQGAAWEAQGWGWDARGFVVCPDCAKAMIEASP